MVDAHNSDRAKAIEGYIGEFKTLQPDGAALIRAKGAEAVRDMGLAGGFLVIIGATGLQLTSEAYGNARPSHVQVALDKAKTVINYRRSSRGMGEYMEEKGISKDDLAGQVGSVLGGGVPVFADPELTVFLAAAAYSGGTTVQDEEISVRAVEAAGFYTHVPPLAVPQEPRG